MNKIDDYEINDEFSHPKLEDIIDSDLVNKDIQAAEYIFKNDFTSLNNLVNNGYQPDIRFLEKIATHDKLNNESKIAALTIFKKENPSKFISDTNNKIENNTEFNNVLKKLENSLGSAKLDVNAPNGNKGIEL